jgi:hypothetical protein
MNKDDQNPTGTMYITRPSVSMIAAVRLVIGSEYEHCLILSVLKDGTLLILPRHVFLPDLDEWTTISRKIVPRG